MSKATLPACVATRLTAPGRGAVAVVAVEGDHAVECVARHFVSAAGTPLASFPRNRIVFGRWMPADGTGEEIVVCRTSESVLEVNCHGGVAAIQAIIDTLLAEGAIEQTPASWANRHAADSIEREAWVALASARTERTAAILLDQYRGALRNAIDAAIAELSNGEATAARRRLSLLKERSHVGLHLTTPWRVVLAGPPNVGKSSLVNCLLGYQRSIVFDQPGTTRDLLSAPTAVDGWPLELTDTAGLRESTDAIEVEGVSRATRFLAAADLTVLVFDATSDDGSEQKALVAEHPRALLVTNKCDLRNPPHAGTEFLATSALTGAGIPELMQQIVKRLVRCQLMPGDAMPFTSRQVGAIESAVRAIDDRQIPDAIASLQSVVSDPSRPVHE